MRHRSFPVARSTATTAPRPARARTWSTRQVLTMFAAVFVFGGLLKLATDDTVAQVASADLSNGPTYASSPVDTPTEATDSDERKPDAMLNAKKEAPKLDGLDAAIVSMLGEH